MLNDRDSDLSGSYRRWRPALLTFFLKRTRDPAEAEDLTHETFARIAHRDGSVHSGYVFQVAANLLRDRARRSHVREDGFTTISTIYGHESDGIDPERIISARAEIVTLLARLEELPERTRAIFVLYRIENVDRAVIAASFGVSASAINKHLARAMAHLMAHKANLP